MKKRIISLLLALVLLLGLLPTAALAANETHENQVHVIVENTTFTKATEASENKKPAWYGLLVDEWVDLTTDSTMMSCVQAAVVQSDPDNTVVLNDQQDYISSINGLAEFNGGQQSGWMGTLNDWFTNVGFGGITVADGTLSAYDEIRIMYTTNGYGEDLGGSWANNYKTVEAIDFRVGAKSVGTLDKTFDKNTHYYTLTVPAGTTGLLVLPTATNKNFQVRASVNNVEYKRTQTLPVADGTVITVTCGKPEWPSMNNQGEGALGATVPAQTYEFTVKMDSSETPPAKDHYLADIAFGPDCKYGGTELNSEYEMTPAFDPDTHEYTIIVPDHTATVYPLPTLSENAPEGSKAVFTYMNYTYAEWGLEIEENKTYASSTWGFQLSDFLGYDCKGATTTLKVGTDEDFETYTFHVKRQSSLNGIKLTSSTKRTPSPMPSPRSSAGRRRTAMRSISPTAVRI